MDELRCLRCIWGIELTLEILKPSSILFRCKNLCNHSGKKQKCLISQCYCIPKQKENSDKQSCRLPKHICFTLDPQHCIETLNPA